MLVLLYLSSLLAFAAAVPTPEHGKSTKSSNIVNFVQFFMETKTYLYVLEILFAPSDEGHKIMHLIQKN